MPRTMDDSRHSILLFAGGLILWNLVSGFESCSPAHAHFDELVADLVSRGTWKHEVPVQSFANLVFTDSGAAFLGGYSSGGVAEQGLVYIMRKSVETKHCDVST